MSCEMTVDPVALSQTHFSPVTFFDLVKYGYVHDLAYQERRQAAGNDPHSLAEYPVECYLHIRVCHYLLLLPIQKSAEGI